MADLVDQLQMLLVLGQLFRRQLSIGTRILFLLASRLGIAVPLW